MELQHTRQGWASQLGHPWRYSEQDRPQKGELLEKPKHRAKTSDHVEKGRAEVILFQKVIAIVKGIVTNDID